MLTQIKVYITAKREHAAKILASIPDGFHCNARWVYMVHTPERPVTHWLRENFDDAIASHFVIFYVEPGDDLNVSLLELGNSLAYDKKIFIASDTLLSHDDIETIHFPHKKCKNWMAFGDIKYTGSLTQTYSYIRKMVDAQKIIKNDGLMENR